MFRTQAHSRNSSKMALLGSAFLLSLLFFFGLGCVPSQTCTKLKGVKICPSKSVENIEAYDQATLTFQYKKNKGSLRFLNSISADSHQVFQDLEKLINRYYSPKDTPYNYSNSKEDGCNKDFLPKANRFKTKTFELLGYSMPASREGMFPECQVEKVKQSVFLANIYCFSTKMLFELRIFSETSLSNPKSTVESLFSCPQ